MDLVEVKNNEIYCDSSLVARKLGQKHNKVVSVIENLIEDLRGIQTTPKTPIKEDRNYRGKDYTAYLMTRDFFSLLAMRFKGKKALEWQIKFNDAFYAMEKHILISDKNATDTAWLNQRNKSKVSRLEETDVIKDFVEYATSQGSKSAKFYYLHITNSTYKALGLMVQKKPKLRDTMDLYEISELILAERLAKNSLKKYMKLGRHYKDIYNNVKDDLLKFGERLNIK